MAIPAYVLVHTAVPLVYDEPQSAPEEWIEGEPGPHGGGEPIQGPPFACVLFLPGGGGEQQNPYRQRSVSVPTLLFNAKRGISRQAVGVLPALAADETPIVLKRESEVLVGALELAQWTDDVLVRWQLVGDAQPFGPPGTVIGVQATLRRVHD